MLDVPSLILIGRLMIMEVLCDAIYQEKDRTKYDKAINDIVNELNLEGITGFYPVGELNYLISSIIKKTLDRQGEIPKCQCNHWRIRVC